MPENQCTATTRAGAPCRRKRVRNADKCQAHGGVAGSAVFDESKFKSRCTANSTRSGERCRRSAIKGGTVCRTHGGHLPAVRKKAKERWRELEEPMVALTERMVERAAKGELTDGDTLRLLSFLADRMGYQRGVTVEHTQAKPWEVTMEHILTELPAEYDYEDDIEDAEVIEEPTEETLPAVEPVRPEFPGPRIGPVNGGDVGVLRYGEPKVTSTVDPPRRKRREHAYD